MISILRQLEKPMGALYIYSYPIINPNLKIKSIFNDHIMFCRSRRTPKLVSNPDPSINQRDTDKKNLPPSSS